MKQTRRSGWDFEKRPSLPGLILKAFRERVMSGLYTPGGRLPTIEEMAKEFEVGRSSVREAMRALQMIGLVDIRQGDGIYLAAGDADLITVPITWGLLLGARTRSELVGVRWILEIEAAGLAATAARIDDFDAMRNAIALLERSNNAETAADADLEFHLAVTRATGNRVLARLLEGIRSVLRPVFVEALSEETVKNRAERYHRAILEAVQSGDPASAKAAMEEHLSFVAETWLTPRSAASDDGTNAMANDGLERETRPKVAPS